MLLTNHVAINGSLASQGRGVRCTTGHEGPQAHDGGYRLMVSPLPDLGAGSAHGADLPGCQAWRELAASDCGAARADASSSSVDVSSCARAAEISKPDRDGGDVFGELVDMDVFDG